MNSQLAEAEGVDVGVRLRAIRRGPLTLRQKAALVARVARRAVGAREALIDEIQSEVRSRLGRATQAK